MNIFHENFKELFCLNNIFRAWTDFRRGKASKKDVMDFEMHLEDNLFGLLDSLRAGLYRHLPYTLFHIFDNKKRDINKAEVRDRVVHQLVYDHLLSVFDSDFISDSYASRKHKGQYKAIKALRYFVKLAGDRDRHCFILKCDVRKYFDNIDQKTLLGLIEEKVLNSEIVGLTEEILSSYNSVCSAPNATLRKGIPLGNVTSQIFANIYLNTLDQYVKKELKCRFYIRYNDDLAIVSRDARELEEIRAKIMAFVREKLSLEIPIEKTSIRKIGWGVDFLGFTILPKAALLRDKTKNKIYSNVSEKSLHSYMSILKHCDAYNLKRKILSRNCVDEVNEI